MMKVSPELEKRILELAGEAPAKPTRERPCPPVGGEKAFTAEVIALARLRGWRVAHFRRVRVQRADGSVYWETPVAGDGRGWPDLYLVRGDRAIAAELKVGKNTPEPEQRAWLAALAAAGVETRVWFPHDRPAIETELH